MNRSMNQNWVFISLIYILQLICTSFDGIAAWCLLEVQRCHPPAHCCTHRAKCCIVISVCDCVHIPQRLGSAFLVRPGNMERRSCVVWSIADDGARHITSPMRFKANVSWLIGTKCSDHVLGCVFLYKYISLIPCFESGQRTVGAWWVDQLHRSLHPGSDGHWCDFAK